MPKLQKNKHMREKIKISKIEKKRNKLLKKKLLKNFNCFISFRQLSQNEII